MNTTAQTTTPTSGNLVVWFRPRRGLPWEQVGVAHTPSVALSLFGTGGRKGGDYVILPEGKKPGRNVKQPS